MSWSENAISECNRLKICQYKVMAAVTSLAKSGVGDGVHTFNVDGVQFRVVLHSGVCPSISLA